MNELTAERMDNFFDKRADGYDEHMFKNVEDSAELYEMAALPVRGSEGELRILDLGCGTGLELVEIMKKAPNALVTGIDLSQGMLEKLKERFVGRLDRFELITGSYFDIELGGGYDYAVSVMSMHHFEYDAKLALYRRIYAALKAGGRYIEGDYTAASPAEENGFLQNYEKLRAQGDVSRGQYHIDIPFALGTQRRLFEAAGFMNVQVVWERRNAAIVVGDK